MTFCGKRRADFSVFKGNFLISEHKIYFKGVVHLKKKTFADNLLTPMSSKISISFFLSRKEIKVFDKHSRIFLHIMDFNGSQMVQVPKDSFSANCKLFKAL